MTDRQYNGKAGQGVGQRIAAQRPDDDVLLTMTSPETRVTIRPS